MSRKAGPRTLSRQRGFTLLEAIVAIMLFSTAGIALFGWINTSLSGLIRAENAMIQQQLQPNIIAYLRNLNIQQPGEGQTTINGYDIHWAAEWVEPPKDGSGTTGGLGHYRIALYDVQVRVDSNDGRRLGQFTTRLAGYTQVRQPAPIF